MRFIASLQIVLQKVHKAANREASDRVNIQTLLLLSSRQPGEMEEFTFRLSKGKKTINDTERRDVLTHLLSVTHVLAERNVALRGFGDLLHQGNSGDFLK